MPELFHMMPDDFKRAGPNRKSLVTLPNPRSFEPSPINHRHNVWTSPWDVGNSVLAGVLKSWTSSLNKDDMANVIIKFLTMTRKEWESGDYPDDLIRELEWYADGRSGEHILTSGTGSHGELRTVPHHHMLGGNQEDTNYNPDRIRRESRIRYEVRDPAKPAYNLDISRSQSGALGSRDIRDIINKVGK